MDENQTQELSALQEEGSERVAIRPPNPVHPKTQYGLYGFESGLDVIRQFTDAQFPKTFRAIWHREGVDEVIMKFREEHRANYPKAAAHVEDTDTRTLVMALMRNDKPEPHIRVD